ncbi:MAG: hypothetical protein R2867_12100 [Caldilineaceae bacterium]
MTRIAAPRAPATGYGKSYTYDSVGRMTSYEGTVQTVSTFPAHAIKKGGYSYDGNSNLISRASPIPWCGITRTGFRRSRTAARRLRAISMTLTASGQSRRRHQHLLCQPVL